MRVCVCVCCGVGVMCCGGLCLCSLLCCLWFGVGLGLVWFALCVCFSLGCVVVCVVMI